MCAALGNAVTRRLRSLLSLVATGFLLTACVPSSFNDFPLYMSIRGDEVVFRWCGESLANLERLNISYAVFGPEIEDHLAAEGRGNFDIPAGTEFSNLRPPAGAEYQEQGPVSIESRRMMFFVYANSSDPSAYTPSVVFDVQNPTQIPAGVWIRPDGGVASEPCSTR